MYERPIRPLGPGSGDLPRFGIPLQRNSNSAILGTIDRWRRCRIGGTTQLLPMMVGLGEPTQGMPAISGTRGWLQSAVCACAVPIGERLRVLGCFLGARLPIPSQTPPRPKLPTPNWFPTRLPSHWFLALPNWGTKPLPHARHVPVLAL